MSPEGVDDEGQDDYGNNEIDHLPSSKKPCGISQLIFADGNKGPMEIIVPSEGAKFFLLPSPV